MPLTMTRMAPEPEASDLTSRLRAAASMAAEVLMADGVEVFLRDARTNRFAAFGPGLEAHTRGAGLASEILVPLRFGEDRRGLLVAWSAQPDFFSERDRRFLEIVADWVGVAEQRAESMASAAAAQGRTAAEELLTVLAHDLRNRLTPIQGRLNLIRRRAMREGLPDFVRDTDHAVRNLDRLRILIADLLDLSRLDRGLFSIEARPMDVAQVVHDTADEFVGDDALVVVDGPAHLTACADEGRIRQAIENLIANAVNHSPPGGTVRLDLSTSPSADGHEWVYVRVSDEGPGIPAELLPRLFERFSSGPGSVGLGLGLYLARSIAVAHGGTLTVDPAYGHGARFVLAWPVHSLEAQHHADLPIGSGTAG